MVNRGDTGAPEHGVAAVTGQVATLRGAGVDFDVRRAAYGAVALVLAGLAALVVVLSVAGARKNAQISSLQERGVPTGITVTHCLGLMGGSGSNLVGYECTGVLNAHGRQYRVTVPGDRLHRVGSTVPALDVPSDPTLVSTAAIVRSEHASPRVFLLPAILLVLLLLLSGTAVTRLRRDRALLRARDPGSGRRRR